MFSFVSGWKEASKPAFSHEDARTIVEKALPAVQNELGQQVYFTGDRSALITESELIARIRTALVTEAKNLTGESLSSELDVPRAIVLRLLPRAAEGLHGVYIDSVLILPQPRVEQLVEQLAAEGGAILKVHSLARQENLTIKSLEYVVRHSKGKLVLAGQGEYIVAASTLSTHVSRVKKELDAAETPIKVSFVEPDPVLRALVMSELKLTRDNYVPQKYVDARLNSAISAMKEVGYISFTDLAASEIKDVPKFASHHDGVVLKDYVVSKSFYEEQKDRIGRALAEQRYFDLRDLPLGRRLADSLLSDEKTKFAKYAKRDTYPHHLVKPSLERDLITKITKALESDAQQSATALEFRASGSTNSEALLNKVKLPTAAEISSRFLQDLPEDLPVAAQIAPQIRNAYRAVALAVLKSRVDDAVEKLDAKIRAYLNGLKTLQNPDLRAQVWEEWQQYVSGHEYSVPGSEQEAASQFQARPEIITQTAEDLVASTEAKLSKLKKPDTAALILHYAVTVYHARNFVPEKNGLLRIRGKAVPRIMKEFQFPDSFVELRKAIKAPTAELIEQVKRDACSQI